MNWSRAGSELPGMASITYWAVQFGSPIEFVTFSELMAAALLISAFVAVALTA